MCIFQIFVEKCFFLFGIWSYLRKHETHLLFCSWFQIPLIQLKLKNIFLIFHLDKCCNETVILTFYDVQKYVMLFWCDNKKIKSWYSTLFFSLFANERSFCFQRTLFVKLSRPVGQFTWKEQNFHQCQKQHFVAILLAFLNSLSEPEIKQILFASIPV